MRPGQVVVSTLVGGSLTALIALAIGIPLGVVVTRALYDFLFQAQSIGAGVTPEPDGLWLLALVPIVLVVVAIGSSLPARQAARLRVTEAIRYE